MPMQSQILSFFWCLTKTSQAAQSAEKLRGIVIYMFVYDLGGKALVLVVSLAVVWPRRKTLLPWSSVLRPVKLAPTSEVVCAVCTDSYREELEINNVVKQSLTDVFCHDYETLVLGGRLMTSNLQTRDKSARFMVGILSQPWDTLVGCIISVFIGSFT